MKPSLFALLAVLFLSLTAAEAQAQHLSIKEVPLTVNHVLYDAFNQKVYASIPSTSAHNPNTVAQIDATTGVIEQYIFAGSEPDVLALSSDGQYLYVGIDGTSSVARIKISSSLVDQQFSLGTSPLNPQYPYHAGNIIALPGLPQSVAVTRNYFGLSPSNDGVVIYDNGVQRPNILRRGLVIYDSLTASNSPNRLYSYDNESTAFTFAQLNLDTNGVTLGKSVDSFGAAVLSSFDINIKFDKGNGLIYATNGTVVDPEALTDVGTYPGLSALNMFPTSLVDVVPNSQENRVYFLAGPRQNLYTELVTLASYNQTNFQKISSFTTSTDYLSVGDLNEISPTAFVFRSDLGVEFGHPQLAIAVTVAAATASVAAGKTYQFTATATYPDGTIDDVTNSATWASDNPLVATISSTGVAQALTAGKTHITATLGSITSSPATLTVDPARYHVLWNNTNGAASIWNYDTSGTFTQFTYGPYPGWSAKAIADGSDGRTRILWTTSSGMASIWNLDNSAGTFTQNSYGPYSGWTAQAVSVNTYNATNILWNNQDGRTSLWYLNTDDFGSFGQSTFGPYPRWSATAIASSSALEELLWKNTNGSISVGNVGNLIGVNSQNTFGPFAGWAAKGISIATDGTTHILWNNTSGQSSIWNYSLGNFGPGTYTYRNYGPFSDYTAKAIADGTDGKLEVLWTTTSGIASIWNLDNGTGKYTYHNYGPYPGWTAIAISAEY